MADYISSLTGVQVDAALLDMAEHNSEAYAVGERNGVPVSSGDETYNNNAKYYAQNASSSASTASSASSTATTKASQASTSATNAANSATSASNSATAAANSATAANNAADRAEAIVGGQFVSYGQTQGLTDAQKAQARANIMAGGSNENILDNGWFKINQRQTSGTVTTNNTYVTDRWVKGGSGGSVIIGLGDTLTPSGNGGFRQFNSLGKIISGETYTLSALVAGGTVYSKTGIFDSTSSSWQIAGQMTDTSGQLWAGVRNNSGQLDVLVTGNGDITVNAMKLEKGPVSTLKNDFPPTYEYELDKCQWYFERIRTYNTYGFWGMGVATSATSANIIVPMHSKRVGGSYTVTKTGNMRLYSGAESYTVTNIAKAGSPVSNVLHLVVTASGMTAGMPVMLTSNNDASAYIDVSADILI